MKNAQSAEAQARELLLLAEKSGSEEKRLYTVFATKKQALAHFIFDRLAVRRLSFIARFFWIFLWCVQGRYSNHVSGLKSAFLDIWYNFFYAKK